MPPRAANAPAARGQQQQGGGGTMETVTKVVRSVVIFMTLQAAMKYGMQYMGMTPKTPEPTSAPPSSPIDGSTGSAPTTPAAGVTATPAWPLGTTMSMLLYTSLSPTASSVYDDQPVAIWEGLTYGNYKDVRAVDLELDVPKQVRSQNGTWWMHLLLVKDGGKSPAGKSDDEVAGYSKPLTRFLPKRRIRKEHKLIRDADSETEKDEPEEQEKGPAPIVAHWSSNMTLTVVSDAGPVSVDGLTPQLAPHYLLTPSSSNSTIKQYYPPVFPNDFWILRESLLPINATDAKLPLHVSYQAIGSLKFNIFASMTQTFDQAAQQQPGSGAEMDEIKRMFLETSPWLLITTGIITVLHTLFEFLAFSSDIGHWRKKDKDLVGVSLNTILTNCVVQLVILLYLHDSSEETSFMILFGQGVGLLIEAWKITKVVDVRVRENPGSIIGYKVTFEDKKVLSEEEKKTQEYDALAFRLVSYAAMPLLAGYTVYSLLYETHRGWYSLVITTLAQAIYMFGFVQLVPQLIINYKLKSVAHMPMKAMMYKTLGTVIDDFFAFCIRMPWLHRLACFRDDVVFLILLYQRWIYRVDYSRTNEYGQVLEGKVEPVGDKALAEKAESKKDK